MRQEVVSAAVVAAVAGLAVRAESRFATLCAVSLAACTCCESAAWGLEVAVAAPAALRGAMCTESPGAVAVVALAAGPVVPADFRASVVAESR